MTDSKKKITSSILKEKMPGFQDMIESGNPKMAIGTAKHVDFKLYDFLEKETKRLEKLTAFFQNKLGNTLDYSQVEKLIDNEKERQEKLKNHVIGALVDEDSQFQERMEQLFDGFFVT